MAEGFFRRYLLERGNSESAGVVRSAGLDPHRVNPTTVKVMAEIGLDISHHTSNHLNEYLDQSFDYVITVCDNAAANCPIFSGPVEKLHWPFDDPAQATGSEDDILNEFRRIRDEIAAKIKDWLDDSR